MSVEEYDKTVRRSNVIQDESRVNAWRTFPVEGYKNITENKGIITNLIGIGTYLLVHTQHSLFMFNGDATLKTEDKDIQLAQPDAFDTNYVEVFTSDHGYGGLQDDLSLLLTNLVISSIIMISVNYFSSIMVNLILSTKILHYGLKSQPY